MPPPHSQHPISALVVLQDSHAWPGTLTQFDAKLLLLDVVANGADVVAAPLLFEPPPHAQHAIVASIPSTA